MASDYYLHKTKGFTGDYFGHVGLPVKVGYLRAMIKKGAGFRVTIVPQGTPLREVMRTAVLASGSHPKSHNMEKAMEEVNQYIIKRVLEKARAVI